MNLKIIVICIFTLFQIHGIPQVAQSLNQADKEGRKQGHWIKKYPAGNIMYEGSFRDNKPVGEFRRYYENKNLKSYIVFSENGKDADAILFHPNGLIASKGKYVNHLKEGKWKFYSPTVKGIIINEAVYQNDRKNGTSINFFPDSTIAEKINYRNDIKNGEWLKFYSEGKLSFRTNYLNGKLNGSFEAFFENGKPEMSGKYKNDLKEGPWIIYYNDGRERFKMDYTLGIANNHDLDIYESNYADSLERNKVKIADPEKTGQLW